MGDTYPPDLSDAEIEALRGAAKEALRQRCAGLRRVLSVASRRERSEAMCAQLLALQPFRDARVLSAYAPLKFEIDPTVAVAHAWNQGQRVGLPRVLPGTRELQLHAYAAGDALVESAFAVREPLPTAPAIDPDQVDLVLVPGLGFDVRGHRLGYGQGFYDRWLPRLGRAVRVGLAFELSLLVEVPAGVDDVPVDLLVTDKRVIRCVR